MQGAEAAVEWEGETALLCSPSCTLEKGLYFFHFELETENGLLYTCEETLGCTLAERFSGEWQLLVYADAPARRTTPGVIYHVFVDRFRKAGEVRAARTPSTATTGRTAFPNTLSKKGASCATTCFFGRARCTA